MSPLSRVTELAYQRGRFMLLPATIVLVPGVKMLELLLPVLVVPVPVQLSPPAMATAPLPGNNSCELQKMSDSESLLMVRCSPGRPAAGFQTS